jgi:hypothetical protein
MVYEAISKKAIVNLGYFTELKNSKVVKEDWTIFEDAKNQMLNLPPDDRSPYWSYFSNTGSIDGVDVLVSELKQSHALDQEKPHIEKSLTDLLLRNFEGIDTQSYGPPEQKFIFFAPNLDRPYFKKDNKELLIQVTNLKAIGLIHELEELNLIKVLKNDFHPVKRLSEKYAGKLPVKIADELQNYVTQSREEWNNNDI